MGTTWRCPRCGAVTEIEPNVGNDVIAVYDLCGTPDEPRGSRVPVRMERLTERTSVRPVTVDREPALTR